MLQQTSHRQQSAAFPVVAAALTLATAAAAQEASPGIKAFREGRYADAVNLLRAESGTEARAHLAASLVRLGRAASQSDEKRTHFSEAETAANEALAASAGHAVAAEALGEALVSLDKTDDAIAKMSAVLSARSDVAYAYYWRGKAYNAKRQTARMVDDFQAVLQLAPNAPEAQAVRMLLAALQ